MLSYSLMLNNWKNLMTAIACWFNREESDSIWAVSDSRITQQNIVTIVRNYSQSRISYSLFGRLSNSPAKNIRIWLRICRKYNDWN